MIPVRRRTFFVLLLGGLSLAAAAPLLLPFWREQRVRAIPRPVDVVLITMDTTRVDRLGCYGAANVRTPALDALARTGVRFARAYAHAPLTAPSHASLLTGVLPTRHGMRDNGGFVLPGEIPTLAEPFVRAGYRTGAFVSAFVLDRRFGLARGFGTYVDDVLGGGRDRIDAEVNGRVTVDRALAWLAQPDPRPVFAWVHLFDPHASYEPPEPFASRYRGRPYDGEIAYMDSQIGRLLTALAARRRPVLVAAIGDHGESLGAHGELYHSYYIYEETQHVPFLLALPGYLPQGQVVQPIVRAVDVAPTILELAGLPLPPVLDGRSLVPLLTGRSRRGPGPAYLETYQPRLWWGAQELLGIRSGPWLYVRSPRPELYDIDADPRAERSLAARRPDDLVALDAQLATFVAGGDPLARRGEVDPEAAARLRALGYVGSETAPAAPGPLPDAKENGPLLSGVARGGELLAAGHVEAAIRVLGDTLALNPASAAVREQLARAYAQARRHDDARASYAGLAAEYPGEERYHLGLALAERELGRTGEAVRVLEAALALRPGSARLHEDLGVTLLEAGRLPEAIAQLRRSVDLAPRQGAPRLRLGLALARARRPLEAAPALRAAIALSPASSEARDAARLLAPLGERLLGDGEVEEARLALRSALDGAAKSEQVYLNLGLACYRTDRPAEALAVLREGVAQLPSSSDLSYRLGRLLAENGQTSEAERELRRALDLDPARLDTKLGLAELLASVQRTTEAAELYRHVLAHAGRRAEGRRARAGLDRLRVSR